jgi:hypothetical protein
MSGLLFIFFNKSCTLAFIVFTIWRSLTRSKCFTRFDWSRGALEIHHADQKTPRSRKRQQSPSPIRPYSPKTPRNRRGFSLVFQFPFLVPANVGTALHFFQQELYLGLHCFWYAFQNFVVDQVCSSTVALYII